MKEAPIPLAPLPAKPRIGVAMTTYNGARFVGEQIRSILHQSLPVCEIVVGDDASTDDTVDIVSRLVAEYNTEHPSQTVNLVWRLHRPGLGIRDNFADAISATTTDVVFLSDQDDSWAPHKVEILLLALRDAQLVHTDALLTDAQGKPLGRTLFQTLKVRPWEKTALAGGEALKVLLKRNLITGATVALRGDFARSNMPVPPGLIHDEWLAMMAALGGTLRLVDTPQAVKLTRYRQHESNAIGAKRITLKDRFDQLTAGSHADNRRRLTRAESIARSAHRRHLGTPAERLSLDQALAHQQARSRMPRLRLARIPAIAREVLKGNYRKYSRGWLTVARDLCTRQM